MYTTKSLFKVIAIVAMCLYFTACENYDGTCIKGNCTNGQGVYMHPNGEKYVGQMKSNRFHGNGTYIYQDNSTYSGEWKNDKHHGYGFFVSSDGSEEYHGYWKMGQRHGKGELITHIAANKTTTKEVQYDNGSIIGNDLWNALLVSGKRNVWFWDKRCTQQNKI